MYLVLLRAAPELELGEDLVGEGVGHDEGGVTHGAAQVHQPPLCQQDDVAPVSQRVPSQENSVADSGSEFFHPGSRVKNIPDPDQHQRKLRIFQCCGTGSGIQCLYNPGSGMFKKSESESGIGKNQDPEQISGSWMNNPDYIFRVKILKFFDADPGW